MSHWVHHDGRNDRRWSVRKWQRERRGVWIRYRAVQWNGYQWQWPGFSDRGTDGSKCWFNVCLGRGRVSLSLFLLNNACATPVTVLSWYHQSGFMLLSVFNDPRSVTILWPCHTRLLRLNACVDSLSMIAWSCHAWFVAVGQLVKFVHQSFFWNLRRIDLNNVNTLSTKANLTEVSDEDLLLAGS